MILIFLHYFSWIYSLLPRKLQLFLGNQLGNLIQILGYRKTVVKQNLAYAFPQNPVQQKDLLRTSFHSFGNLLLEMSLLFNSKPLLKNFVEKWVDLEGVQWIHEALAQKKKIFFLSSHLGNWEIMAAGGSLLGSLEILLMTKKIKPHWLHQALEKGRAACRVQATYEPKTLKAVFKHLQEGKIVGCILDQYAGPPVSVRVPFFGIPVGTSLALATLVKRTGALVFPVKNFRTKEGRWKIQIFPALPWLSSLQPQEELAKNTAQYTQVIETHILEHPEQWLWIHRRFKGFLGPLAEEEWSTNRHSRADNPKEKPASSV